MIQSDFFRFFRGVGQPPIRIVLTPHGDLGLPICGQLQLTRGAVSACCITEPVHVEGGASVVLAPGCNGDGKTIEFS